MSTGDSIPPSIPLSSESTSSSRAERRKPGRPRKDGRNDTPADRRRVQLRLAQRKSRSKKELSLASKHAQVDHLQNIINSMNTSFLHLNKAVVDSAILRTRPCLLLKFQETARRFVQLNHAVDGWDESDPQPSPIPLATPSAQDTISEEDSYFQPSSSYRKSYFTPTPTISPTPPAGSEALLSNLSEATSFSALKISQSLFSLDDVESFGRRLHYNTGYLAHWSLVGSDALSQRLACRFFKLSFHGRKREEVAAALGRTLTSIARIGDRIDLHAYQEAAQEHLKELDSSTTSYELGEVLLSPYDVETYLNDKGVRFHANATEALFSAPSKNTVPPRGRLPRSHSQPKPNDLPDFPLTTRATFPMTHEDYDTRGEYPSPQPSRALTAPELLKTALTSLSRTTSAPSSWAIDPALEETSYESSLSPESRKRQYTDAFELFRPPEEVSSPKEEEDEEDEDVHDDDYVPPLLRRKAKSIDTSMVPTDNRDGKCVDVECLLRETVVRGVCNGYSIGFSKAAVDKALRKSLRV